MLTICKMSVLIYGAPPPEEDVRTLRFIDPPKFSEVLQRWVWPSLEVRATPFGHGLFANRDIEPGLMIPYVGDAWNDEAILRREASHVAPSRYILEDFDADPEVPACRQHYCIAGFSNEAYDNRIYNCGFVAFNKDASSDIVCQNMPYYHHFDSWGGFMVTYKKIRANEELCVYYGKSYSKMRDYVPKPFTADPEYKAYIRITDDLKTVPRPIPVTYSLSNEDRKRPSEHSWDFEASFIYNGKPRWYKGRVIGRPGAWVTTEFEDGEIKSYRKTDFTDNPKIRWIGDPQRLPV